MAISKDEKNARRREARAKAKVVGPVDRIIDLLEKGAAETPKTTALPELDAFFTPTPKAEVKVKADDLDMPEFLNRQDPVNEAKAAEARAKRDAELREAAATKKAETPKVAGEPGPKILEDLLNKPFKDAAKKLSSRAKFLGAGTDTGKRPILTLVGGSKKAPAEKKAEAPKTPKAKKAATPDGYKGHRFGSRKGDIHKVFDDKGVDKAREFGLKAGIKASSLAIWFKGWGKPAPVATKKKG
jgi:hypothetical protein